MLISSARNAAQVVLPGEDPRFYDDLGCMASDDALEIAGAQAFVQIGEPPGWTRADEAFYAQPVGLQTPMGYGFQGFARVESARQAAPGQEVLDLAGLRERARIKQ
jgi:hypothetical protein